MITQRELSPWVVCKGIWLFVFTAAIAGLVCWVVWVATYDAPYDSPQEAPLPPGCAYSTVTGWSGGRRVNLRVPVCAGQQAPGLVTP